MPDLLDRRLDTLLVEPRTAPAWTRTQQKITRRRRAGRAAGVGVAAALLLVVAGTVVATGSDQATRVQTGPASPSDEPPFEPGWTQLPDLAAVSGPAEYPVLIAAGGELFAWAGSATGQDEDRPLSSGLVFDPETTAWRPLDDPIAGGLGQPGAVAVGDEVLFVGTGTEAERWSPTTGTTEPFELPDGCYQAPSAWDESTWWFVCGRAGDSALTSVRAYDLATGSWEVLPEPPVSATYPAAGLTRAGTHLVLAGPTISADGTELAGPVVATYDLRSREWSALSDAPIRPFPPTIAATDTEVLLQGDPGGPSTTLDAQTGIWSQPIAAEWADLPREAPDGFGCLGNQARAVDGHLLLVACRSVGVLGEDRTWNVHDLPGGSAIVGLAAGPSALFVATAEGEVWRFVP